MTFPIFDKLGGEHEALAIVAKATGKEPTKFARDKWRAFGRLPATIANPLILECSARSISITSDDCEWPRDAEDAA